MEKDLSEDWNVQERELFGRVYRFMVSNQAAMCHPRCSIPIDQWQTICHNAAWIAADLLNNEALRVLDLDTEEVIAESPKGLNS